MSPLTDRLVKAVSKRVFHAGKLLYQGLRSLGSREPKRILFIFGCQRSGTTLLQRIFDEDLDARVYGEFSEISQSGRTENVRLRRLEEVKSIIDRDRARLVVAKPIVETQNALKLLEFFAGSKALFPYRHYAAVVSSNLRLFGRMNGINNLRPIVNGESGNWRAEGLPQELRALVAARFRDGMNPYDAAALFWYLRNRFFFDLGLDRHPAVMPLRYEDLVRDPSGTIEGVYRFLGMDCPRAGAALVRGESSGRAKGIELSADIEQLCRELLGRLDRACARAWNSDSHPDSQAAKAMPQPVPARVR